MNDKSASGFTLVELMITLVVGSIIAAGVFAAYSLQSKTFSTQSQVSRIQQDLRGAIYLMEFDLLNACRDPDLTNQFAITNVRSYDFNAGALDNVMGPAPFVPAPAGSSIYFASYPVLEFTSLRRDTDGDGVGDQPMTIRYQIFDFNNDGRPDLGRRIANGIPPGAVLPVTPDLVAEGVVAIGYAFAYNQNPNGKYEITRTPPVAGGDPLGNVIWAIDSNSDNRLDTNIDVTGDGQITLADDISGDGVINALDGGALPAPVPIANAVAVRFWLLVQSATQSPENVVDNNQYVVADRIVPSPITNPNGFQDRFRRRVKTVTVALRNYRKS
jgi:prepilin-type N-terminal cleavage/methylation domain-containing protein